MSSAITTAWRLEAGLRRGVPDARGRKAKNAVIGALRLPVRRITTRTVYRIQTALRTREREQVKRAFTDPVTERAAWGRLQPPARFDWIVEVGFKPGVTDNVGRTARVALEDVLDRALRDDEQVFSSIQYFFFGRLTSDQTEQAAFEVLANPLIQTVRVLSADDWRRSEIDSTVPVVTDTAPPGVQTFDLGGTDEELLEISRKGMLSLDRREMGAIRSHFSDPAVRRVRTELGLPEMPTDVELECLAQTWSEHCSHKIFAASIRYRDEHGQTEDIHSLFKTFIQGSTREIGRSLDWLVSVFTDNAGIIRLNDRLNLVYKVETHNSPSALDPYGGAMTGIVGVNRDPMGTGLGAALLCNVWGYCLGSPFYADKVPAGLMHPRRIRDGVHQGVIDGGNQSGVPWMRGWERFDDRYVGKPLVFCGTVGTLPARVGARSSEIKEVQPGDVIVMAGGRIGKDGIHGATFSSEELREEVPVQVVQIGDPITQRKLYEFILEARDRELYRCVTDNGAGGLSCSVGEMARLSGGADLDLAGAPLKYPGLQPWEILVSEAQERMTLAVPPERLEAFLELARRRDVEAVALGTFTDSGMFAVRYGERLVGRLDMHFLYQGCPVMSLEANWKPPVFPPPRPLRSGRRNVILCELLASLDICSKEYKSRQYDGEVKGLSVIKPFVGVHSDMPADATVMRVAYDSDEGIILAEGINPFYSDLDTYAMAASVIDEAVRRVVSAGAEPGRIAGLDNFCWPDPVASEKTPDGAYKLAQLVRANRALYDVTTSFGVPCISGKDSCKNDSTRGGRTISVPPTLLFSTLAMISDVRKTATADLKREGDLLYVLGLTRAELGASAFHRLLAAQQGQPQHMGGSPPALNTDNAMRLYRALHRAIQAGLVRSSHTPTLGGLAVAFALTAMGGDLGAEIDLARVPADKTLSDDEILFSESNSRFVVSVAPEQASAFEALFAEQPCARIGVVRAEKRLRVTGIRGRTIIDTEIERLRAAFTRTLHDL